MPGRFKNYRTSIKETVYYVSDKAICRFHAALKQTLNKESPMMPITATSDHEPEVNEPPPPHQNTFIFLLFFSLFIIL